MGGINFGRIRPSFLIIGAQKSGTTSLYSYLEQHPRLFSAKKKELHYFDSPNPTPSKEYLENFPKSYFTRFISFESTPRYLYFPGVAKKLKLFDATLKFVVILRNPVDRAFSAWNMYRQWLDNPNIRSRFEKLERSSPLEKINSLLYAEKFPSFAEWVAIEMDENFNQHIIEPSIIRRGYYADQIREYYKFFEPSKFLFLDFEEFSTEPLSVLNKVCDFIGINTFEEEDIDLSIKNKRSYISDIDDVLYNKLLDHFKMKNQGLEELTSVDYSWMN